MMVGDVPAEGQLTAEHVARMTPAQITVAYEAGRLVDVLSTGPAALPASVPPQGQVLEGELRAMSPAQVVAELKAGRLDFLTGRMPGVPPRADGPPAGTGEF